MSEFYVKGNKLLTDKDIKIDTLKGTRTNTEKKVYTDIFPGFKRQDKGTLIINGDGNNSKNLTWGFYSAYLGFAYDNVWGALSISYNSNNARISGGNDQKQWTEDIAFKSDIQRLEQRISALEKKIGGTA